MEKDLIAALHQHKYEDYDKEATLSRQEYEQMHTKVNFYVVIGQRP